MCGWDNESKKKVDLTKLFLHFVERDIIVPLLMALPGTGNEIIGPVGKVALQDIG